MICLIIILYFHFKVLGFIQLVILEKSNKREIFMNLFKGHKFQ